MVQNQKEKDKKNHAINHIDFPQMGNFECAYILVYNNNANVD